MIKNFEEITKELSEDELSLIPYLLNRFNRHHKDSPIKAPKIVSLMNEFMKANGYKIKMNEPRLRKCCNYIRANSLLPLIATSDGYYVSNDKKEIADQIKSLRQRAQSILNCADGLDLFLKDK